MRGYHKFNEEAFYHAARYLKVRGHGVINPHEVDTDTGMDMTSEEGDTNDIPGFSRSTLEEIIKRDVDAILQCDAIYLLAGYQQSVGAKAELGIARWAGLKVIHQGSDEELNI
jgi:predicted component of type VI protein secretion system